MKKTKNISLLVLIFLLLFVGIISKTNITQVTSELIQMKEANNSEIVFVDIQDFLSQQTNPNITAVGNPSLFPIFYNYNDSYANSKLVEITIPVGKISSLDTNQTITIHVAPKSILTSTSVSEDMGKDNVKSYEIILDKTLFSNYNNVSINNYINVDISSYNIEVNDNEVIGVGAVTDTISWFLRNGAQNSTTKYPELYISYTSSNKMTNGNAGYSMLFNFKKSELSNDDIHDSNQNNSQSDDIPYIDENIDYGILNGKNISIIGDSISTYKGYSNDALNTNNTIGSNNTYYNGTNGLSNVDQTWWMQAINATKMNLLVNNSWSGSSVIGELNSKDAGVGIRTENLHDNTGDNAGTTPDIIAVYMGTNDLGKTIGDYESTNFFDSIYVDANSDGSYDKPVTFAQGYAIMLDKITKKYPNAKIYTFTILENSYVTSAKVESINNAIKAISNHYEATVVDICAETGITSKNAGEYMLSNESSHIHPNQKGMDLITKSFLSKLSSTYKEENKNEENNQDNDKNEEQEEIENPFTSTSLIKIISLILIVGSITVLISTFKNTKINKYE